MLRYDSPADVPMTRPVRRLLLMVLLIGHRDKADRIRFSYGPDSPPLQYRVNGEWFEMVPPPRQIAAALVAEVRGLSRLVAPEVGTGWRAWLRGRFARPDGPAAGWLTVRFLGRELLHAVRLDPDPVNGEIVLDPVGPGLDPETASAELSRLMRRGDNGVEGAEFQF